MSENDPIRPAPLRYQDQRGLDDVAAYVMGLQVRLSDGVQVYLALSAIELTLYFDSNLALHYDLEGRLVKVADGNQFWRRSLSGRVLQSRKLTAEEGGGLERTVLPAKDGVELITQSHHYTLAVCRELRAGTATVELGKPSVGVATTKILPALELAAGFDPVVSARNAEEFQTIYGRVAVLPPDQYNALVLQATEGCAYAGCTFCELYRNVAFRKKSLEEFRQHIKNVIAFHGESLRARRSIFLGEANALTQPAAVLKDFFRVIKEHFELPPPETPSAGVSTDWWMGHENRFDGVSSFLDAFTNTSRTATDYFDLRREGLRRVYVGMETGDESLLKWLRKPSTVESTIKCVRLLKESDIIVGVIVLVGAGGREHAAQHVRETVKVLNELPLARNDLVFFSPLVVYPGCQYDTQAMSDAVTPLTEAEMKQQEQEIRQALRFDARRGKPYLARYELETFVY